MLESFFAGIGIVLASIFGGHPANFVPTVPSQPAAAVVAAYSNENATTSVHASTQSSPLADATRTIVSGPVTQPSIERTEQSEFASLAGYVTREELTARIDKVTNDFGRVINGITYPAPTISYSNDGVWNAIALSNRIEHLSGTSLSSITVSGVSGLTDADIPDLSGAYLSIASTTTARSSLGLAYASSADITNNTNIATWGDSLTAGSGGNGTTYQTALTGLSGYTIYNGGVGGETSTQIKTRMLAATSKYGWPTIIWAGRNNYTDPTTVKADVAAMVAALTTNNYIILGVINGEYGSEHSGQSGYSTIVQLNTDLASIYGTHFIDIRSYLVSLYDSGIAQDVTDHTNDIPPSSLRYDNIHLTAAGYAAVAEKIYENISLLQQSTSTLLTQNSLSFLFGSPPAIGNVARNAGYFSSVGIGTTSPVGVFDINGASSFHGGATTLYGTTLQFRTTAGSGSANLLASGNGAYVQVQGSGLISNTDGSADLGYATTNYRFRNLYLSNSAYMDNAYLGGQVFIGTSTASLNGPALEIGNDGSVVSGVLAVFGQSNSTGRWQIDNAGSPTTRRLLKGFSGTTETVRFNPAGDSFLNGGGLLIGTTTNNFSSSKLVVTGGNIIFAQDNGIFYLKKSDGTGGGGFQISGNGNYVQTIGSGLVPGTDDAQVLGLSSSAQRWRELHVGTGPSTFAGSVGVGTTTAWRTLSVTGTDGFDGLTGSTGAGSLCLDSNKQVVYNSGSDACLSSTRVTKHDIENLNVDALAMVASLQPVSFIYNNDASSTVRYGFIAEDAAAVDKHFGTYNQSAEISGIDDRSLIAVIVGAVQALAKKASAFADSFATKELTFVRATGDELTVKKLCVEDVCVTRDQFLRMVEQGGQAPAPSSPTPSEPEETPVDGTPLSPSDEPAPLDKSNDAENIPEVSDAPPIVPTDTPEEIPATEPVDAPAAQ